MNTQKKYLIGLSVTLVLALAMSSVALAHGGDNESSFGMSNPVTRGMGMMGGRGMMNNMMWNGGMDGENWGDMGKMHNIMWGDDELTPDEFEWARAMQIDHMGWSHMDDFENSTQYNNMRNSRTGHSWGMMHNQSN